MYLLPVAILSASIIAVVQGGGYARPPSQQYPWTSYTTERATDLENLQQPPTPSDLAPRIQPVTSSSEGIKGGGSRPLGHGHRTPCGPYPWALCQGARRRFPLQGETSGATNNNNNNNNKDGDNSLETSASENTFSIAGPGLLDNRIYGLNGDSYHSFSVYRNPVNGQTFTQRTYVPTRILFHRPHHFGPHLVHLPSPDPGRKIIMYGIVHGHGHGCNKCGGTTAQPDWKTPRVPAIYRTSTTQATVETVEPTTSTTPYPPTTSYPESQTSNPQFGSGESSEVDIVTTAEPPATTAVPDYDKDAESV